MFFLFQPTGKEEAIVCRSGVWLSTGGFLYDVFGCQVELE